MNHLPRLCSLFKWLCDRFYTSGPLLFLRNDGAARYGPGLAGCAYQKTDLVELQVNNRLLNERRHHEEIRGHDLPEVIREEGCGSFGDATR